MIKKIWKVTSFRAENLSDNVKWKILLNSYPIFWKKKKKYKHINF